MEKQSPQELLQKVRELVEQEGLGSNQELSEEELIKKYIIPALKNTGEVQSDLYLDFTPSTGGFLRKIKNNILRKVSNITRNTVERSWMKQEKFNKHLVTLLEYLYQENLRLRSEKENES